MAESMSSPLPNWNWNGAVESASVTAKTLQSAGQRIVLAESCTSGLMAATLGSIPGASDVFCGSAVTYRDATKHGWLGIDAEALEDLTAVSAPVTRQMAIAVLRETVEADWSLAITGHLGPNAPSELDGKIFVSVARANPKHDSHSDIGTILEIERTLESPHRGERQFEACVTAWQVLLGQIA